MVRALLCLALAVPAYAQDPGVLRERHASLREQLAGNPFGRPVHVDSAASGGAHQGEIHALIERPFAAVAPALARAASWCDILTLQVNVKRCEPAADGAALAAYITRKPRDLPESAHRVDFRFEPATARADYLRVSLSAPSGPMGTRDYRIVVEAAPLDSRRTILHMSYAYTLGWAARMAMDAYLAGPGRDKPGFSVTGGERAIAERGAMRHYLGIDAYLSSLSAPPAQRLETRLREWYAATASYPQLREPISADEYLQMKRDG
jgi:hypothetical protein